MISMPTVAFVVVRSKIYYSAPCTKRIVLTIIENVGGILINAVYYL